MISKALADNYEINLPEEKTIKGQVICAQNSKFTVECGNEILTISARGKIKYKNGEVLTGDFVEIQNGIITAVYPRRSRFMRPNVANIDTLCVVISNPPKPDFKIVDKMLLTANYSKVKCALIVNKSDLDGELFNSILKTYGSFTDCFSVSAKENIGIDKLREYLSGKTVAFAGQSAVGKTSVINALFKTDFKTGELSEKLERGRHTTTYSRIIRGEDFSLFDTPGFSELCVDITPEDTATNFPPYENYLGKCKFLDCSHTTEPDCAIKNAVNLGELSKERYSRYKEIYEEIKTEYKNRYGKK